MADARIILRKNKRLADGTYPIAVYIYRDGKETYIHIGYSVNFDQWDDDKKCVRKSHPNHTRLNYLIKKRLSEASNTKIQLETEAKDVSLQAIKQKIKPKAGKIFFLQAQDYLEDLKKAGKFNQYTPDKPG